MPQHDYNLANQTPASYRTDHNNLNLAVAGCNASSSGITTSFAHMLFADVSSSGWMRQRNAADSTFNYLWPLGVPGGIFTYAGNPSTNHAAKYQGQPLYDTSNNALYVATLAGTSSQATWSQVQFTSSLTAGFPSGYMAGPPPKYNSASQIIIQGGFKCRDDGNAADISFSTAYTIDLTVSGAGGLSTDLTEAANTWYYLFAIRKSTDGTINGILTTATSGPTMPSGYDQKRMLPIGIRNSSVSDILDFTVAEGWPGRPMIKYQAGVTYSTGAGVNVGGCNVLNGGTTNSFADVSCTSYIPPISRYGVLSMYVNAAGAASIRTKGSTNFGWTLEGPADGIPMPLQTDTGQTIQYQRTRSTPTLYIDVMGYVVTEMAI